MAVIDYRRMSGEELATRYMNLQSQFHSSMDVEMQRHRDAVAKLRDEYRVHFAPIQAELERRGYEIIRQHE